MLVVRRRRRQRQSWRDQLQRDRLLLGLAQSYAGCARTKSIEILRVHPLGVVDVVDGNREVLAWKQIVDREASLMVRPHPARIAPRSRSKRRIGWKDQYLSTNARRPLCVNNSAAQRRCPIREHDAA